MAPQPSKKLAEYYRDVQATEAGQHVFADLLMAGNVYSITDTTDPIELARCEGERRLALRIVQMLSLKPSDFVTEANEAADLINNIMRQASPSNGQLGNPTDEFRI
jgi:hypothetical protein